MIYTTAYVSTLVRPLTGPELAELLEVSRAGNARAGVTGMLLLRGLGVMQVLEGEEAQVRGLLARIAGDPRHTDVVTVWASTHDQRRFPDWSMGFEDLAAAAPAAGTWPEPDPLRPEGTSPSLTVVDPDGYVERRGSVLRGALVSGHRLVTSLAIILHGHRPEAVLDHGTQARFRCAECRALSEPDLDRYPCPTARNAIWALEAVAS